MNLEGKGDSQWTKPELQNQVISKEYVEARKSFKVDEVTSKLTILQQVLSYQFQLEAEKFVIPWSLVQTAEILQKIGKEAAAKELFQQAKTVPTPYDFDKQLAFRINRGLQSIKV